jgi:hypothetical protein
MATAPSEISTIAHESATRPSIRRRIAERSYAPEALLLYSALSFFFFGRNLIGHFSDRYVGMCRDPAAYMLFFEWWRYALANHLNPFNLTAVWYPSGFNLAWAPSAPLAAWAVLPIDATFGPVAAYNVGILLCPALSAWSAFLLCRYITRSYWPSLAGGYTFGFSAYMLAHLLGHIDLSMVFLLPLAAYLVSRWLANELPDGKFVTLLTLVLFGQFMSALEVLATMTLMGAIFLALVWIWAGEALRRRIMALVPRLAICFTMLVVLTSPYLYYFFRDQSFSMAKGWASLTTAAPDQLFVPASTNIFGRMTICARIIGRVSLWETGEYVGIPLFLLLWNLTRTRWNEPAVKALTIFAAFACAATLGPQFRLWNGMIIPLPWLLVARLPLLHMVMPTRLSVYLFLDLAVVAAMWLANSINSLGLRIGAAAVVITSLLPNPSPSYWAMAAITPSFFRDGIFRSYLSRNETILILPYGFSGGSDLWLAEARMYFRMAGGYVGVTPVVPPSFDQYPIVNALYNTAAVPDADEQLKAFLLQKRISAVIVADKVRLWEKPVIHGSSAQLKGVSFSSRDEQAAPTLIAGLHVIPIHVGGVWFYRVPLEKLRAYAAIRPEKLQKRMAAIRFATLVTAANQYVARGYDPRLLTPLKAQQLGLLPPRWVEGAYEPVGFGHPPIQDELSLSADPKGNVTVGVGSRAALQALARDYGPFAMPPRQARADAFRSGNAWLFPPGLRSSNLSDVTKWLVVMQFQPSGARRRLRRALSRRTGGSSSHARLREREWSGGPGRAVKEMKFSGR